MDRPSLPGSSAHERNSDAEVFLEEYDAFIRIQARKNVTHACRIVHPDVLDMEIDEIAQKMRIKLWQARQKQHITNPNAYISRVAHNETISMVRQHRPTNPLPLDDDGDLYQADVVATVSQGVQDPAETVEQEEIAAQHMHQAITAIAALPKVQRRAMLCSMKERVDDLLAFTEACQARNIDVESIEWPVETKESQSLRTSVTIARQKLRSLITVF